MPTSLLRTTPSQGRRAVVGLGAISVVAACEPSEADRSAARADLDAQLAAGGWDAGTVVVRYEPGRWVFEDGWDPLQIWIVGQFLALGLGLGAALGRAPGRWRVARAGLPAAAGAGLALAASGTAVTTLDAGAGVASREEAWLGRVRATSRPLEGLSCRVEDVRFDGEDGASSHFAYRVRLRGETGGSWPLVEVSGEAFADAVCERIEAELRGPRP